MPLAKVLVAEVEFTSKAPVNASPPEKVLVEVSPRMLVVAVEPTVIPERAESLVVEALGVLKISLVSSQKRLVLSCKIAPPAPAKRTEPEFKVLIVNPPPSIRIPLAKVEVAVKLFTSRAPVTSRAARVEVPIVVLR